MALELKEQFFALLTPGMEALVALPTHPSTDAVCAGLALKNLLVARGMRATIVSPGFTAPSSISWLPGVASVQRDVPSLGKLLVQIDLGVSALHDIAHEVNDGKITLHIVPGSGLPISTAPITPTITQRFGLVVTVGAQDHASLGAFATAGRDLLLHTPVINIDNHPANERFGTLNLVHPASASLAEIVYDLAVGQSAAMDPATATYLLTGLLSATKSFKQESVSPRALAITAELMTHGAAREEIVKNLYRTRSVETLRLWGRALSRLKHDGLGLVWTTISSTDYLETGAGPEELPSIIEELIAFAPEAEVALIMYETSDGVCGLIETREQHNAGRLAAGLPEASGAHRVAKFCVRSSDLLTAERNAVSNIKSALQTRSSTLSP